MSEIESRQLTLTEASRLAACEAVIRRGFNVFFEVGQALTEIRDAKLYRAAHKTFDAYCKDVWNLGRSRAYELIDQAKVASGLVNEGVDLSAAADISKRDAAAIKNDVAAVAAEIKSRVEQGEPPGKAIADVIAEKREERQARGKKTDDAEWERQREQAREQLPDDVKQRIAAAEVAKAANKTKPRDGVLSDAERIAELKQANAFLEGRVAELEGKIKTYERLELMYRDWTAGGWEQVIQAKDDTIAELQRTAQTRIARESGEKVRNLNAMRGLAKKLDEAGKGRDVYIDPNGAANG